ncbi:MAG TPA: prolyl oligopeptidase family serine peptidase [bacterium]|jgi:acetyl esterase/lipase|nr:prolyl oligopeptidase family serine peptidase [bacterium]
MAEAAWRRRFRAPRLTFPTWARDEPQRVMYASNHSGKWELYAWDRPTGRHRQVTDRPEGTIAGRLDPTGEWIWWFDDDRGNEFGRWMIEPFAGGERRQAAPALPPAYGAGLALAHSFALLGSSRDEGTTVYLLSAEGDPSTLYQHREHAWISGLSRDQTLFCLSHSEHGDNRHPALRLLDLSGRTVADLWDGPGKGLWASEWSPVRGDQRIIVHHERADLRRPLIWGATSGDIVEPEIDLPGEVWATWFPDASALLMLHDHRGRTQLYRLDLSDFTLARLDTEPGTIVAARVRPDGELWYMLTRSSAAPELRAGGLILLRPGGEPAPGGAAYTDHTVDDIHVFLAEPAGARPHPTLLLIHGGPDAHDRDEFSPRIQAWVDHGFAVALVNYRGSTGYGKAWRDALEGNPGFTELADIVTVRDWLESSGIADPARTVLAGGSWGGYLTLLGLGRHPELWALGIAIVPVADYAAAFEDEMEPLKAFDKALFGGTPEEIPEVYRARSPITYVDRVRVPVFILAGENDPRCPIRQIDNYLERLRELGTLHEVYRYDAGHGSLVIDEVIRQTELQIDFAARHLGTSSPLG